MPIEAIRRAVLMRLSARKNLQASVILNRVGMPYLPWSTSTMHASGLLTVLNEIIVNGRETIVEIGSGISTLYMARLLKERRSGRLISVENDADWVSLIEGQLNELGIGDRATVVHAPLEACTALPEQPRWYRTQPIFEALGRDKIDLLLVDGPRAKSSPKRMGRWPAVPVLADRLNERCVVILDDCQRKAERRMAKSWRRVIGTDFKLRFQSSRLGIAQRGPAFKTWL